MNLSESFLTALDSIMANKMRAVLTMLGVIIGVASVIALMAIGNGITADVTSQIAANGTNLITVSPNRENDSGYPPLSLSDAEALAKLATISEVAANSQGNQTVVFASESINVVVSGITANYLELNSLDEFQVGDSLTQRDLDNKARVVVLGAATAIDLFGEDAFPVGKSIKINSVSYEVIGVLTESGGGFGDSTDDSVFMPLTTAQSRLYPTRTRNGEKSVSSIAANVVNEDQVDGAMDEITTLLTERHDIRFGDEADFSLFNAGDLLETVSTVTASLTAFLGAIAGISLVVGGIGIMNIMLVSVTERTREIGIRKAVGALRRDILLQFLLESLVLSLLGGAMGIGLGYLVSTVAQSLMSLTFVVAADTILLSTGFAAGIGIIFGIYPAWRASSLRPIEALRYE